MLAERELSGSGVEGSQDAYAYPEDLARFVRESWEDHAPGAYNATSGPTSVPEPILERLLSTSYQASLLREEERPVSFRAILAAPEDLPEGSGPPNGLHRLAFVGPRPFDERELRRLSPAADFEQALVGVRRGGGGLEIWGLVHTGARWLRATRGGRERSASLRPIMPSSLNAVGPVDQREVEGRDDVLCFTTPVLEEPVEVTGHVSLELYVASSAPDTDFTGKLVDVFPDGRAIYLTDGILRARYRDSLAEPQPLVPEKVYEVALDLSVTSNVFLPGHRIRLEVSSSNFPRYDRNTNTGGTIAEEGPDEAVAATNRVLHGAGHPSRLILPVINR